MRPNITLTPVALPLFVNHPQARQYQKMSQLLDIHPEMEALVRVLTGLKTRGQTVEIAEATKRSGDERRRTTVVTSATSHHW